MKRRGCSTLLAAAAMLLCAPAESQASSTSWVDGVSVSSGWSDFDKGRASNDGDNNLCWAASASCIIDYWQSLYITASTIPTGEAIWTRFKEACTKDLTGNQLFGIQWWLAGDYSGATLSDSYKSNARAAFNSGTTNNPIPEYSDSFAGYYWDVIPDTYGNTSTLDPEAAHIRDFLWYANGPEEVFSTTLIEKLVSAPIGLGLRDTNKRLGHAITLWGVEYEGDTISSIWITDSDDYTKSIREIQTDLIEVGSNTYVRLIDYSDNVGYGDVYIVQAYGINTAESDTWALERVPEPTTTILTLSAFVLLCSRCRRKKMSRFCCLEDTISISLPTTKTTMKKLILALAASSLALVSCTTSNIHQSLAQPEIQLTEGNYQVVATQITGRSVGLHVATLIPASGYDVRSALNGGPLGGIPIKAASESAAIDELYQNAGIQRGRATAFINMRTEVSGLNCVLFAFPKITVKADLIEFDRTRP